MRFTAGYDPLNIQKKKFFFSETTRSPQSNGFLDFKIGQEMNFWYFLP